MKTHKLLGSLFVVMAVTASSAYADVINFSQSFNFSNVIPTTTKYGGTFSGDHTSAFLVELPKFDSALGLLTGVELSLSSAFNHISAGAAYDTVGASINGGGRRTALISGNSFNFLQLSLDSFGALATKVDVSGLSCTAGNSHATASCSNVTFDTGLGFNSSTLFTSNVYNLFMGTGQLMLGLENQLLFSAACDNDLGDSCTVQNSSSWAGSLQVQYSYAAQAPAAAPEPASLMLLSLGLFGLIRRNKKPAQI